MQYKDYIKMRNFTVTTEEGEYKPRSYSPFSRKGVLRYLRNVSNTTNSGIGLIKLTVLNYLSYYGILGTATAVTGIPLILIPADPLFIAGFNPVGMFNSFYSKYDNKISEIVFKLKKKFNDNKQKRAQSSLSYADKIKIDDKKNYIVNVDDKQIYLYGNPEGYDRDLEVFTEINRLVNNGITEFKVITGKQVKKLIPKQYLME